MAITIKVGNQRKDVGPKEIVKLDMRKNLKDDIMIFDHADIVIVLDPTNKKVCTYAKDVMNAYVYGAQSRLFNLLSKKGLVDPASIQGGNVFESLEGEYYETDKYDAVKLLLLAVYEYVEEERPYFEFVEDYEELVDDSMIDPTDEDSTALGEVPQETRKGSVPVSGYTYGNSYYWNSFTYE
jgi:hypothetical protein